MKHILRCIILVLASTVYAEDLQFDITGTAYTQDNPDHCCGPAAGPFDMTFVLDTAASTFFFVFGNSCLQHFDGLAALSNINVSVNGQSVMSASSASGGYGGDNANGQCPGLFFAGLGAPSFLWEFDSHPGTSQATLMASNDPIATLFTNFQEYPGYVSTTGYNLGVEHVSVRDPVSTPEPGTLPLIALGFVGLVLARRLHLGHRPHGA